MSTINIQIIDVAVDKQGKYEKMSVSHKLQLGGTWKTEGKAMVDFATDPDVWNTLRKATKGAQFIVTREKVTGKDGKEYWNWVKLEHVGEGGEVSEAVEAKPAAKADSFAARDDVKQRYIIRQSCLKAAVDLGVHHNMGSDAVLAVAEEFVEWVLKGE